jgi:hypothetical protein
MKVFIRITLLATVAICLAACNKSDDSTSAESGSSVVAAEPTATPSPELKPLVAEGNAPAGAIGVAKARQTTKSGDNIVMVGRVKDFVDGKAMFTMMDSSIPSCADEPGDTCSTPWDYCCEPKDKITSNSATVKLVKAGTEEVLPGTIQGVNSLDHLTTVVVEGKADRDDAGNLVVAANKVYLKK